MTYHCIAVCQPVKLPATLFCNVAQRHGRFHVLWRKCELAIVLLNYLNCCATGERPVMCRTWQRYNRITSNSEAVGSLVFRILKVYFKKYIMAPSHNGVLINEIPDGNAHGQSSILQSNCVAIQAK